MDKGSRYIDSKVLSDRLNEFPRMGIKVPALTVSTTPVAYKESFDSVEIYMQGDRLIVVKPGHVMDEHGNVVDMYGLECEVRELISSNEQAAQYFRMHTPIHTNGKSIRNFFTGMCSRISWND